MPLVLAILFLSCSQLASQIFLPAMPDIALSLNITKSQLQQIMMYYFICLGVSQLVVGPLCDYLGNRAVFLFCQILFILGSLTAGFAHNEVMFALGRILQGLGAAAPLLISRTILASSLEGKTLKSATASLSIAASLVAVIAPWFGGVIATQFNWQILFLVVTVYFLSIWFIGFFFLSNNKAIAVTQKLKFLAMFNEYKNLIIQSKFLSIAAFKWVPTFLYLTSQIYYPFELQEKFNLSAAQYGTAMMIPTLGLVLGTVLAKILQKKLSFKIMLLMFWPLIFLSGLTLYVLPFSLFSSLFSYSLLMIAFGTYYPCCIHLIVTSFKQSAATASALVGAIELLCFSLLAMLMCTYLITSYVALSLLYLVSSLVLLFSWFVMNTKVNLSQKNTTLNVVS
ncbi:MFS transporter [Pseudoalteromonas sp. C2R02]|uniref:MFS transporter n=1 Tax=Pseudoalteromonas sp. C2R02 TaxID=2841565 RepID=UPI001C0A05E2|nr:MFS transporter [Pseudoalteromonas sp. C2R02]